MPQTHTVSSIGFSAGSFRSCKLGVIASFLYALQALVKLADRGLGCSAWLVQTRIETARALLGQEHIKLQDIATELGYQHGTHFSRAFKRVCGVTPRHYRAMQQH